MGGMVDWVRLVEWGFWVECDGWVELEGWLEIGGGGGAAFLSISEGLLFLRGHKGTGEEWSDACFGRRGLI